MVKITRNVEQHVTVELNKEISDDPFQTFLSWLDEIEIFSLTVFFNLYFCLIQFEFN